ncbi:peptidase [Nonomuraea sp. KC401]|uniref:S41 family peptidase n=1 Tax=unclassified Nonomuraea TaxID=2593643 RepID=UPI0010FF2BC0|nr:S41 family peptidase [Nonomuraea sp. KC401]NBE92382.1 peptidase [Nonomuraea sp. K271]TLF81820.1 peptidase [Nonomuraea sp. KC401]
MRTRSGKGAFWPQVAAACTLLLAGTAAVGAADATSTEQGPPPCVKNSGQLPSGPAQPSTSAARRTAAPAATQVSTIGQAYTCILDHYFARDRLDHRGLLAAAFGGLTVELGRHGLDRSDAVMPPLSGDRAADWNAFAAAYERIAATLPADATRRQAVAAATINAMVGNLHDNHVRWSRIAPPPGEPREMYGLGIATSYTPYHGAHAPQRAQAPLHITAVTGGPAAERRLRPGDIIESVNGAPPFAGGVLSIGALGMLHPNSADDNPVRLTLRRPASGRTWTVSLRPERFTPTARNVTPVLLDGDIAAIRMGAFTPGVADQVLAALTDLGERADLRGIVLDLRGNTGGSPAEVARLLGAFTHGKVTGYTCDSHGACTPHRTDDTVPLLKLPLAVLTDGICASACDHFVGAVKHHRLGPVIGTRTSGMVSGVAYPYVLDDGSTLHLPTHYGLGPAREIVNGIGVPPDHVVPRTAKDLSTGRDPAMTKALARIGKPS